jgi:hypothetical protein
MRKELLIKDLQRVAKQMNSDIVRLVDYKLLGKYSKDHQYKCFGTWKNALDAAGLKSIRKVVTKKDIIEDMQSVISRMNQKHLSIVTYYKHGKYTYAKIKEHFANWKNATKEAGIISTRTYWASKTINKSDIIEDIQKVNKKLNKTFLSVTHYLENGIYNYGAIKTYLIDWDNALDESGINRIKYKSPFLMPSLVTKKEFIDDLISVHQKLKKDPFYLTDYIKHGKYPTSLSKKYFGNWNAAMIAAGLETK